VNNPIEVRKVVVSVILSTLWICCFLFINDALIIDWTGDGSATTPLKPLVIVIGLLVLFFYNQFYRSSAETTKLSWTVTLTLCWLALVVFYPFKDPAIAAGPGGAVGFFTLVGGLAVCVLWVRFFSDEIVA
jgi:uncharacterized membrane protein YobD (UPF0266 family)